MVRIDRSLLYDNANTSSKKRINIHDLHNLYSSYDIATSDTFLPIYIYYHQSSRALHRECCYSYMWVL